MTMCTHRAGALFTAVLAFLCIGTPAIGQQYRLNVGSGTGTGWYTANSVVNISATVGPGFVFGGWSHPEGCGTVANASSVSTTFTMGPCNDYVNAQLTDVAPPNSPPRVRENAVGVSSFTLKWDVPYDNSGYISQYQVFKDGALLGSTSTPEFFVSGVSPGVTAQYTVRASDATGNWSAQSSPVTVVTNEPVLLGIHAAAYGVAASSTLTLSTYEGMVASNIVQNSSASGHGNAAWTAIHQYRGVSPGLDNQLVLAGPAYQREVRFEVPAGYTLFIAANGIEVPYTNTATIDLGNGNGVDGQTTPVTFSLMPNDGSAGLDAGYSIDPQISAENIAWSLSLGRTPDGLTLGSLALLRTDLTGDPFSPDLLKLTSLDSGSTDAIQLISDQDAGGPGNSARRFIWTPQCLVWLDDQVPNAPVGYCEVKVYDPNGVPAWDGTGGTYVISVNGSAVAPFAHYSFQSDNSNGNSVSITKNQGQTQQITWKLSKSVSGGSTTWTLQRAGNRTLKVVESVSSGTTTQAISLTDAGGNVAQTYRKVFQKMPWGKNELTSECDDPSGLQLTTSYTYGTDPLQGSYGKLISKTNPDGTYIGYDYYSDDANFGNLYHTYTPWLDVSSTAATASAANAQVVAVTYKPVHGFLADALDTTITSVPTSSGPVTIHKTARNPDFTTVTFNGHKVRKETIQSYYNATGYLSSTRLTYHPDETASDRANQLISETAPNGTKVSTIYYQGYYDSGTDGAALSFHASSTGMTNPVSAYGEFKFNGFSSQPTGSQFVGSYDGQTIDSLYLVPLRSTVQFTLVINGQPIHKLSYVFTGADGNGVPSFEFTGEESLSISTTTDGTPTTIKTHTAHNGAQSIQTFVNGRLTSDTGNDNGRMSYVYDSTGLLMRTERNGINASGNFAAQGIVYTHYGYDAASRKTSEKVSTSSDSTASGATTVFHYDSAGRLDSETDPSGITTTFGYDPAHHQSTVTLPGGATKIVTTYADGETKSITGTGVLGAYTNVIVNSDGTVTTTNYALRGSDVSAPTAAPRWTKITTDWLGRTTRSETPANGGSVATVSTYNPKGELVTVQTVDGSSGVSLVANQVWEYDAYENAYRSGLDLDGTPGLQPNSASDRIIDSDSVYQKDSSGAWWLVSTAKAYNQASVGTAVTTTTTKVRLTQFGAAGANIQSETVSTDVFGNQTDDKVAVDRANLLITETETLPNSSTPVVSVTRNGLVISRQTASNLTTTYAYDGLRRLVCASDPRIDGTSLAKDLAPRIGYFDGTAAVGSRYQKAWTKDTAGNQTSFTYSTTTGLLTAVQSPPILNQTAKYTYYDYTHRGELCRRWGAVEYPVEYAFDDYGEKVAMRTFGSSTQDFTTSTWPRSDDGADSANPDPTAWTGGNKTTWAYDPATGALQAKTDAAGKQVGLTYTKLGMVRTKTLARNVSLTYQYYGDTAGDVLTGELKSVDYSNTTTSPDVTYTYDRLGRPSAVTDATGSRSFAYDPTTLVLSTETLPALLGSRVLTEKYDVTNAGTKGRGTGFSVGTAPASTADYDVTYSYDAFGRAGSVTSAGASFVYGYTSGSNLINTITDSASGFSQTRSWMPNRDLLASIDTKVGTASKARFVYAADEWGRRTSVIRSGEVYARYLNQGLVTTWGYDDRSQVTSAQSYYGQSLTDLSYPVEGRSYGFTFDNIGNRLTSSVDGRGTTYHSNNLNEITDRVTPGSVDVAGFAPTGSTVQVNGQAPTRQGDYYHAVATVSNGSSGVNAAISVTSTAPSASVIRKAFVPQNTLSAAQQWQYDADGNVTQDDQWTYTWDAENRLIAIESRADLVTAGVIATADAKRVEFTYDYRGRRARKYVRGGWNGSTYASVVSDTRFVYHGWNLVSEYSMAASLTQVHSYTWGLDLSGTLAGDGGTGGLLMMCDNSNSSALYTYAYDGNGNVSALMNRSSGATVAEYEYGTFGEPLRASDTMAQANPFRFSTQYVDAETGLTYYGYRYYNPQFGRFLGRDLMEEKGGLNLYHFCLNNSVNYYDHLGKVIPGWNGDGGMVMWQDGSGGNGGFSDVDPASFIPSNADPFGPDDDKDKDQKGNGQGSGGNGQGSGNSENENGGTASGSPSTTATATDSDTTSNTQGVTSSITSNVSADSGVVTVTSNASSNVDQFLNFTGTSAPVTTTTPSLSFDFSFSGPTVNPAANVSMPAAVGGGGGMSPQTLAPNNAGSSGGSVLGSLADAATGAGVPTILKDRVVLGSTTTLTSPASVAARGSILADVNLPVRIPAPTYTSLAARSSNLGTLAGRGLPLVGAGLIIYDVSTANDPARALTANWFGTLGGSVGGTLGTFVGFPTVGAVVGGTVGNFSGGAIYDGDVNRANDQQKNPFRRDPGGGW